MGGWEGGSVILGMNLATQYRASVRYWPVDAAIYRLRPACILDCICGVACGPLVEGDDSERLQWARRREIGCASSESGRVGGRGSEPVLTSTWYGLCVEGATALALR